ncbi:STAS/SEC14 domain-containing protein [Peribacillus sp. SCS-155]|uniref:STAS/SEC14 domain-containing protein n=1 Tax=Peribacillus sedimenti TaxID=3115297 RepID=UPI0039057E1C
MLTFIPSKVRNTIAVEFDGKATKEDAIKLDNYVKEHYSEDEKFNILAILHDLDGSTLKGITEGVTFDIKRWKQFRKFAVVTDKNWIKSAAEAGNYLPGIEAKHFEKGHLDAAWDWIMLP